MFEKPQSRPNFSQMDTEILKLWKQEDILNKSINHRPVEKTKAFYDGPITANGEPHHGHMLTFALKDLFPRYWTMQGYRVTRNIGWDCQGLPVEVEVEKDLGFEEKNDIEKYGIAEFNKLCRESVVKHKDTIIDLEERMGRLTNEDYEYATMNRDYIESVWWSVKELYEKGLLYEGFRVMPYSTRAGTPLSNAEVALGGYEPVTDPAVTMEFPLVDAPQTVLLAWTTTPWTLPTNFALAVGTDISYVTVSVPDSDKRYVVAEELVDSIFEEGQFTIEERYTGDKLTGKEYQPLFDFFEQEKNRFFVYEGHHVTTEGGTGIVHLAPYGAEDVEIFSEVGIKVVDVLDEEGNFTEDVPTYSGQFYRDANANIIEDLKTKDRLFKHEDYEHQMPICWRTKTPLIYKPITAWYVAVTKIKDRILANNERVHWTPDHIKHGRFGKWLENAKDWNISRNRYWATPMPIWKGEESGDTIVIGSYEELESYGATAPEDPHRPFVDEITFEYNGETYRRISDVLDVWYDSGAMPFARFHYPFENQEEFQAKFPAEYIAEGLDQTRGWFYSLMILGTALFGDTPYKNVMVNGLVLADDGSKLSKSKQNYQPPQEMLDTYGADAVRLNFFATPISAGEDTIVSPHTLRIYVQEYLLPLWNMVTFFTTYANAQGWEPVSEQAFDLRNLEHALDRWIYTRLQEATRDAQAAMDDFHVPGAVRVLKAFFDDLSKWYIRRSRDRFAEGETEAFQVLYYALVRGVKLLAPFTPYISEQIYQTLVANQISHVPESVHLTDYPEADESYIAEQEYLLKRMDLVREIVGLGHTIREAQEIKVRQPLSTLYVASSLELQTWMKDLLTAELNIKEVKEDEIPEKETVVTEDSGRGLRVGLDTEITPELKEEGQVRDIIRNIQAARKKEKLSIEQTVDLSVEASEELQTVIQNHEEEIKNQVGANTIAFEVLQGVEGTHKLKVSGEKMRVKVEAE